MKSNQLLPGQELYNHVRAGFILQNTSLSEWCNENKVNHSNSKNCLYGAWDGPKAKDLRQKLIDASNIENLTSNAA